MATKLTKTLAMEIAETAVAGRADLTHHKGQSNLDRAIRLSGLDLRIADEIGPGIAEELPGGKYVRSGDFAAVWYDIGRDIDEWRAEKAAYLDWVADGPLIAHWYGGGSNSGEYVIIQHGWHSADGDVWTDDHGRLITSPAFDAAVIELSGGPRDGEVVA